jgi:sulfoxide reductase heme-binding subunit YedZ
MLDEHTIRLLLRVTARISLLFFAGAFAGRAARLFWPSRGTAWLERNRDRLILGLAGSHTIHLAAVISLAWVMGSSRFMREFHIIGIVLGVIVYGFIYALAFAGWFPKRKFKVLSSPSFRSIALYAIWFVFASAFVAGSVQRPWIYLPFAVIALGALALRIAGNVRTRREAVRVAARAGR